ncbi:substrate-binding domain-containing protein [Acidisoma silvae]|uniref:L-arabinose-binding periplasmic protein n=1 Tax=Acidisoma silvae TaxID=2802396 RepID=A0A963YVU2_9PROT|nr:substrate-binding domain-containing protein [Acidisoma silvae]MCB8877779.1 substrate-binding domain-containing protein [Acidisoma silvae]
MSDRIWRLAASLAVAAGLGGAGAHAAFAQDPSLTIAYIQKQGDQQYFVDEAQGAKDEAKALGHVKVNVVNVQMDANAAISAMNVMVGQKVSGIAIVVPDQQIGPQVIDMATQAKIPLVSSDDPIKSGTGSLAPFVGFDGYQMGYKVGQAAGALYKKAGWTASTTRVAAAFEEQLSVCQDREHGEEDGFKAAGGDVPTIVKIGTDNSVVDAQNRTGAVVTANPQIKHWVVWGCNDENETGAVTALANAGLPADNIIGVGLGAYLTCKDWQAGQTSGNKAALFISGHDVGSAAIKVLVESIRNHTPLPAKTIANTTIVTPANWKGVMGGCS